MRMKKGGNKKFNKLRVEFFPKQLIGIFGAANESSYYTEFAVHAFRIYLCMIIFACVNKSCFIFLQAMGKALSSTLLSMTREIVFGVGFAVGFCQKIYFTDSLILPALLITGSDLVYGIYYYVVEFLMRGRINFGFCFLRVILPEMIYTALAGILLYRLLVALEQFLTPQRKEA